MTSPASPIATSRAIRFLVMHLRRHAFSLLLGFIVLIGVDLLQLVIPRIIQQTLDSLSNATYDQKLVVTNTLLILLFAGAMVLLRFLWRLFIVKPSRLIEERMRNDLFGHIEKLSAPFFNRTKTGDLMALFVNDIGAIRMATGMALIGLFDAIFMSAMSLAFMIAISPRLTLVTAAPLPAVILLFTKAGGLIQRRFTAVQESFATISSHTQESFSGIRVLKSFAQEPAELAILEQRCNTYVKENLALTKVWGLIFPAITLLASFSYSLLLLYGSRLVIQNDLTIGEFISFTFYINMLVWPMVATGWVFNLFQRGIASAKRVLEIVDSEPDVRVESAHTSQSVPIHGTLEFRNCTFRYGPELTAVLRDISLTVPAGSSLGIIGRPGSGKSTLLSLLFHQYPLDRGMLFIDGRDINDLPLETLRGSIAYVPQDSFLFSDTIASNIGFSAEAAKATRPAIEQAAALADIQRDISTFPLGYETRIGERGVTLSGGQKQRVAIARALMAESARILLLDDALSSVDAGTEEKILSNIRPVLRGITSILIAHRISTIKRCDHIVVIDEGTIIEQGDHERLVAANGFYRKLYDLQRIKGLA
ncbi:MAG: ABC transporter ATP-binding protein [Chitinispirillaceae bacterium]|nr:ABC transporter ATP-binding protein [Chitinispirillaceae bacterium]